MFTKRLTSIQLIKSKPKISFLKLPMYSLVSRFTATQVISIALVVFGLTNSAVISAADISVQVETGGVNLELLDDVTFISKKITTPAPRTLVIHYFAECQVSRGHIEYDIVVNKGIVAANAQQVPPTHDNTSVLCSNDGTSNSSLSAASVGTVVACTVPSAGNYTIRVRGHVKGGNAMLPAIVDDQSLVIEHHALSKDAPECIREFTMTQ